MYEELIKLIRKYDGGVPISNDEFMYPIDLFSTLLYGLIDNRSDK